MTQFLLRTLMVVASLGAVVAHSLAFAQSPPLLFEWGHLHSPNSGNTDADIDIGAGYNALPYLWHFDPMENGVPSPRARATYVSQQSGATASIPSALRGFVVYLDAAVVVGGNAVNAGDIANTIAWFQNQGQPIDYVFADFEGTGTSGDWSNTLNLINQLRANSLGVQAFIGNYAWFPGTVNLGADYPHSADLSLNNSYYASTASNGMAGLNVAMPVGYPLQAYAIHADDSYSWGANWWTLSSLPASDRSYLTYNQLAAIGAAYLSPNERAGMFYAPLEQVSVAKRNLPAVQQLIPWISAYQDTPGQPSLLPGQVPTAQDNEAFLEHIRLRGADGFYAFGSPGTPGYTGTYSDGTTFSAASLHAYAADMASTWHKMDWFFALPAQVGSVSADRPLNLLTFKNTGGSWSDPGGHSGGIEWSAYQRGNRVLAVISNLGNAPQAANGNGSGIAGNWQSVFGTLSPELPSSSPVVPAGNHLIVQYLVNPTQALFSGYSLHTVLGATQGWHTSNPNFVVATAAGSGDSGSVVAITGSTSMAWFANAGTANPGGIGATADDAMTYSFRIYTGWTGSGSASFAPVVGSGSSVPVSSQQNGPTLWVYTGGTQNYWAFGSNLASGGPYHSINFTPASNTWYEVQMVVNPSSDTVAIFARNLTASNATPTPLQFDDSRTLPIEQLTVLPASLIVGEEEPSLYDGFQIGGSAGSQFDDLGAQLYTYPASPQSSYVPVTVPPSASSGDSADGPLPTWALLSMMLGILGAGSYRLQSRSLR
jgi:hypothetical protein